MTGARLGVERDLLPKMPDRLVRPVRTDERRTEIVMDDVHPRPDRQRGLGIADRLLRFSRTYQHVAQFGIDPEVARVSLLDTLEKRDAELLRGERMPPDLQE